MTFSLSQLYPDMPLISFPFRFYYVTLQSTSISLSSLADVVIPRIHSYTESRTLTHLCLPFLPPLSCTIFRLATVVAGPSQAFLVFNLSFVRQLSLRLNLLYQYQAIASEVPHDRYTTASFICEPPILRPIA